MSTPISETHESSVGSSSDQTPTKIKRVLFTDDNMVVRMVMKRQLEKSGYLVDLAESGEAAVAAVTRKSYAAILMDCQLPGMSGYQAAVEIRNIEGAARHTPIIAFTGSDKSNERQRCLEAGMDDYLVKPATVRAILAALADWGARP